MDDYPAGEHLPGEIHAVSILIEDDLACEHHVLIAIGKRTQVADNYLALIHNAAVCTLYEATMR